MDPVIAALARAAGLHKALVGFPYDVTAAAEQALAHAGEVKVPADPAAEPWPPMRPAIGLQGAGERESGVLGTSLPEPGQ